MWNRKTQKTFGRRKAVSVAKQRGSSIGSIG